MKKIMLKLALILSLLCIFGNNVIASDKMIDADANNSNSKTYEILIPFKENELWGYKDIDGNVKITPQFKRAGKFSEGLAVVKRDDKFGYINTEGNVVIPCKYEIAYNFSNGYAVVMERNFTDRERENSSFFDLPGPYIYINKEGKNVFNCEFYKASDFKDGYARVMYKNHKTTYIDTAGKRVIYTNENGQKVLDLDIRSNNDFEDGYAIIEIRNKGYAVIDKGFKVTYIIGYKNCDIGKDGIITINEKGKFGAIDANGNVILEPKFDKLSTYNGRTFSFTLGDLQGFIDLQGNIKELTDSEGNFYI